MLDGELDAAEYKALKVSIEEELRLLHRKLSMQSEVDLSLGKKVDACIELLKNLAAYYRKANVQLKQRIVGSIFPRKLVFNGDECRTPLLNEAVALIFAFGAGFKPSQKKKGVQIERLTLGVVT